MIVRSVREENGGHDLEQELSGRWRQVADYFSEEVLSGRTRELRRFLVEASVAGRLVRAALRHAPGPAGIRGRLFGNLTG